MASKQPSFLSSKRFCAFGWDLTPKHKSVYGRSPREVWNMDQKVVDLLVQIVRLLSHGFDARQASPKDVGYLESAIEKLLKHDADPEVTRLLAALKGVDINHVLRIRLQRY
jgi:hypothetical protein